LQYVDVIASAFFYVFAAKAKINFLICSNNKFF